LAELAADRQPAWAAVLGPTPAPDDDPARRQWIARAAVIVAYRDRYQHSTDDPIGPVPSRRDPTRWAAWHRAQAVLGVATLAGQAASATTRQLRALIDAQQRVEADEPHYVAGKLRVAHLDLLDAERHVRELRIDLAVACTALQRVTSSSTNAPRWWQLGPLRGETGNRPAPTAADTQRVDRLRRELGAASTRLEQQHAAVAGLEAAHAEWLQWYHDALPTRY